MRIVSPFLKHVVYPGLSRAGYFRRVTDNDLVVLTYHGVLPAGYRVTDPLLDGSLLSGNSFRSQLRFLKSRYNVISPEEFLRWCQSGRAFPPRSVLLTCDDGLQNCLYDMLPILQETEVKCLFFVTGASLANAPTMLWYEALYLMFLVAPGNFDLNLPEIELHARVRQKEKRTCWWEMVGKLSRYDANLRKTILERIRVKLGLGDRWDAEYREDPAMRRRFLVLNPEGLRVLAAAGMSVGAHTSSHPVLSQLSEEAVWSEISNCKRDLEQALDRAVPMMAYPFGDESSVTVREQKMAERAGFHCAFRNAGGSVGPHISKFSLPRVHVNADMNLAEFEAHISGVHQSLQQRFRATHMNTAAGVSA
jgi:peptidoglycan/xylan/chitin deacetylase (PgdA/CDA1 family)